MEAKNMKLEKKVENSQFGFRTDLGTKEALFCLNDQIESLNDKMNDDCKFVLAPDSRNTSRALIIRGSQYQKTRVRQCCILSLMLFNLYLEEIFIEALDDASEGINVNGVNVNNIRYADDTLIVTKKEDLQKLME